MARLKILMQTNGPQMKTGLGENGRALMKYFYKRRDKYDFVYYCTQTNVADPILGMMPVKSYGCLPNDQNVINQLNQDGNRARDAAYGGLYIDEIVKKEKPDIWLGSDDIWSFNGLRDKPWFKGINPIYHVTVDSRPILDEAFQQAKASKNYFTWANFAAKEMHRFGPEYAHVKSIYGASDLSMFHPISKQEKLDLRKRFNLSPDDTIFLYMSRNQLRKGFPQMIQAYAEFRKEFPYAKSKLHFHTSFSEKGAGWDIPKLMTYHGVKKEEVLCTYVCKECGQWHVKPYDGEDIDCPYCGAKKSMVTVSIVHGVPDGEMALLHGLSDASPNPITSGGLERGIVSSLMCGLPTAATNYSCGEDYCEQPFIYTLKYHPTYEAGTNFIKAATDIVSLKSFFARIYKATEKEKQETSERGIAWAKQTFSTEVIGAQWEQVFDNLKPVDWSTVSLENAAKHPDAPMPTCTDDTEFITTMYKTILNMDEGANSDGTKNWLAQRANGVPREQIYAYFVNVARQENAKLGKQPELWDLLDKNGRKRGILVAKESIGDCLMITSLFKSFREEYPDTDLYVATDPKHLEVFEGNPYVHKVLNYVAAFEQEMLMMGAGQKEAYFDYFFHPCITTQRLLHYLTSEGPAYNINQAVETYDYGFPILPIT